MIRERFRRFKRRFMSDIWRRIAAVALAWLVWGLLQPKKQHFSIQNVPIEIHYDKDKIKLYEHSSDIVKRELKIVLEDPNYVYWNNTSNYELSIDLTDDDTDADNDSTDRRRKTFSLKDIKIRKPDAVKIEAISPEDISLSYDTISRKQIGFAPLANRVLASGEVIQFSIPKPITVKGPTAMLQNLNVLTLSSEGLTDKDLGNAWSRKQMVDVSVYNPNPESLILSVPKVKVYLNKKEQITKIFHLPLQLMFAPQSDLILAEGSALPMVDVKLQGVSDVLNQLKSNSNSLRAYLDLTDITEPGELPSLEIHVSGLPHNVQLVDAKQKGNNAKTVAIRLIRQTPPTLMPPESTPSETTDMTENPQQGD